MKRRRIPLLILILAIIGFISVLTWYKSTGNKAGGIYSSILQSESTSQQELKLYILSKLMYQNVIVMTGDSIGLDNYEAYSHPFVFEPILILRTEQDAPPQIDSFTIKKAQIDSVYRFVITRLPNDNIRAIALLMNKKLQLFEMEKDQFNPADRKAKKTYFVKMGGTGNGRSWAKATGDLQSALKSAKKGDQIWVAAGKYFPTKGNDRNQAFKIPDGVKLYGGFVGTEKKLDARDWKAHPVILSGEIGANAINDNSYTVVYTKNVSAETLVDGFTITGGAANGFSDKGTISRCGGGWYNDGSNGTSNPIIINCEFVNNYGRDGAGLYNYASKGMTNPTIQNCVFRNNRADLDGGAIHNNGSDGTANPIIDACVFQENEATYGAGIFNSAISGEAKPLILNCNFISNIAYIRGSSIYNSKDENGITEAIVQNCRFEENTSTVGQRTEEAKVQGKK